MKPLSRSQNTEKTRLQESEVRSFLLSQTILFKYICLYIFSCIHVGINIRILWDSIFCLSIGSAVLDFKRFCTAIFFFYSLFFFSRPSEASPETISLCSWWRRWWEPGAITRSSCWGEFNWWRGEDWQYNFASTSWRRREGTVYCKQTKHLLYWNFCPACSKHKSTS